jgi:hypothetical protein
MKRLQFATDSTAGRWLEESLQDWGGKEQVRLGVGSLVPNGFEAYARIFHAIHKKSGENLERIRWSSLIPPRGTLDDVIRRFDYHHNNKEWDPNIYGPAESLSLEECDTLVPLLEEATNSAGNCWFAVWYGFGNRDRYSFPDPSNEPNPPLKLPHREYFLYSGPVDSVREFATGPQIWWPEDHSWVIHSEIDLPYTYLAGSHALVDRLLRSPDIEAQRM